MTIYKKGDFLNATKPLLSPNGQRLIFEAIKEPVSLDGQDDNNRIFIVNLKSKAIKLLYKPKLNWILVDFKWLTSDKIVVQTSSKKSKLNQILLISLGNNRVDERILYRKNLVNYYDNLSLLDNGLVAFQKLISKDFDRISKVDFVDILTGKSVNNLNRLAGQAISELSKKNQSISLISATPARDALIIKLTLEKQFADKLLIYGNKGRITGLTKTKELGYVNFIGFSGGDILYRYFEEGTPGKLYTYNSKTMKKIAKNWPEDFNGEGDIKGRYLTYETVDKSKWKASIIVVPLSKL